MYNEGTGAVGAGGVIAAGGLARTGFNFLALAVFAFTLLLIGAMILRAMSQRTTGPAMAEGPQAQDPFAALASAIETLSQDDL